MDKLWIKVGLVLAFAISLIVLFKNIVRFTANAPAITVDVAVPASPVLVTRPKLPDNATSEQITAYLAQSEKAAAIDKQAIDAYVAQVNAYSAEVKARITAARAEQGERPTLDVFEKAVKDTLGQLIIAPLLAALLLYSGIKVAGDVAMARATTAVHREVDAP